MLAEILLRSLRRLMQNLLYKVALITIEAGKIALRYYGKEEFSLKEDSSPITQAD